MKVKASFLIFLFLFPAFAGIQAATDEGYGETETALGQFVDSFETSNNVSVNVNVVRNTTLELMELNFTGVSVYYNVSDFVETDPANRYSQTDLVSTWAGIRRGDADSRLVGDLGVNYFQDSFSVYFEVNLTDADAGDISWRSYCLILGLMNHATNYDDNRRIHIWANQRQADPANDAVYEVFFHVRATGGAQDSDTSISVSVGTVYFMNLTRHNSGDSVRLTIKTGSHTGAIHDTLDATVGVFGGEFLRYVFTPAMKFNPNDPNDDTSGTVSRITEDIGGGFASDGYFTTTDYMADPTVNGETLVQLTNTSIPVNTAISIEFSEDNSTWTGTTALVDGFQSIDLRDLLYTAAFLRFNLSTTDSGVTPRVYQSRLITTKGNETIVEQNVTGSWIEYNLTEFNASVGTVDAGLLNSTFLVDGITFDVSEVVGVPGMMLSGNFTGVDEDAISLWLLIYAHYDGNLNHDFDIEMWNFDSSTWVEDNHILDGVALEWYNSTIYPIRIPNDFLSGGEVRIRLDHESAGNINHDLMIDQIQLQAFIPSAAAGEPFQFFWIVIGIALMIIGIVLARMWPDEGDP